MSKTKLIKSRIGSKPASIGLRVDGQGIYVGWKSDVVRIIQNTEDPNELLVQLSNRTGDLEGIVSHPLDAAIVLASLLPAAPPSSAHPELLS